jgi:hypothetical protein
MNTTSEAGNSPRDVDGFNFSTRGAEKREVSQCPWELLQTEFYQFLNISLWQGSTWLLSVSAQHIKSSSLIPRYAPSKMAAYSKAIRLTM